MVVLHSRVQLLEVVEFVVVGGEQGLGPFAGAVDVFHEGAGYRHSVVGRGAAADFIEQHERAGGEVVHDHRGLQHLHHEGGFAAGDVVGRAHPGEDLVEPAHPDAGGRNEGADLSHQHDQRGLAQQRRLSGHVGAREYDYLVALAVHADVVGHVFLAGGHQGLDHGMAAGPYVESRGLVDHRPAVVPVGRLLRESLEHVEARDYAAVLLNVAYGFLYVLYQLRVQAAFGLVDGGFGAEYLLLVFLEFGGYVALGVHEGLLAYPLGRDPVAGAVADFDVVAEDVVVAYL